MICPLVLTQTKLLLYADDGTFMFSHKNPEFISRKLGKELESCSERIIDNKLSLHLGKTECILFGSKWKLKPVIDFQIACHGHIIKSQSSVKYLGIDIDENLPGESITVSNL